MSKEAETSHSQPLPHFRSFRSDLHLHSSVVQCHSRKQQLIGMTPERGRNAEGRGQKWDAFPLGYNSTFQAYALHKWLASSLWKPFVCHYIEPAPIFIYSQKQTCG